MGPRRRCKVRQTGLEAGCWLHTHDRLACPIGASVVDGGMDLRKTRLDLDVTTRELAIASGVHRDTIRRIERFEHTPSVATVKRLATALTWLTGTTVTADTTGLPETCPPLYEWRRATEADPARGDIHPPVAP